MKIIVCVKPIPDPNLIQYDIVEEKVKSIIWILNPADVCALEEGIKLRNKYGGEVIAISFAPRCKDARKDMDVLKAALIHGADRAIRIWDDSISELDPYVISDIIAEHIKKLGFNLVLCGSKNKESEHEFMGAALAERLNLPLVTRVIELNIQNQMTAIVIKKLERGKRETYEVKLPAVLGLDEGINQPRYNAINSPHYKEGIEKDIKIINPRNNDYMYCKNIKNINVGQWKPRTKSGQNISGLSMADMLKLLRGEKEGKKEIFTSSSETEISKLGNLLLEWMA